jgi:hypothetical protein
MKMLRKLGFGLPYFALKIGIKLELGKIIAEKKKRVPWADDYDYV